MLILIIVLLHVKNPPRVRWELLYSHLFERAIKAQTPPSESVSHKMRRTDLRVAKNQSELEVLKAKDLLAPFYFLLFPFLSFCILGTKPLSIFLNDFLLLWYV